VTLVHQGVLAGRRLRRALGVGLAILAFAGCAASVIPPIHSEPERLAIARRLSAGGKCREAVGLFRTYVDRNAGSAEVDEAIYDLGACHLALKEYAMGAVEFERLLRDYPESDSAGAAAFRLGEAYYGQARPVDFDQEETRKALEQWQRYRRDYPGHWLQAEADRRISIARHRLATKLIDAGKLYLKLKLAKPARVYFERVANEYSDTALLGDALIGLALADAMAGQRTQAVTQLKAIEDQFPGQPIAVRAARERERLER